MISPLPCPGECCWPSAPRCSPSRAAARPTGPTTGGPASAARTARLSRTRFLAFGDSLTAGEVTAPVGQSTAELSSHAQSSSPRLRIRRSCSSQLASRYASQASAIRVINAGVPGENLFTAALRFETALSANSPEAVIIMHGLNNLGGDGTDVPTSLIRGMVQDREGAEPARFRRLDGADRRRPPAIAERGAARVV